MNEYNDTFKAASHLPGKHKIILHENTTPVIAPFHKIPLALDNELKNELLRMEQDGIIEKIIKPTD